MCTNAGTGLPDFGIATLTGNENSPKGHSQIKLYISRSALPAQNLLSRSTSSALTEIGAEAFFFCRSLGALTLPEHVQTVGAGAFLQAGLTEVNFAVTEGWMYGEDALPAAELAQPTVIAAYLTTSKAEAAWHRTED